MINTGLIGYGYWGEIYARLLSEIPQAKLSWICDTDKKLLKKAKKKYGVSVTLEYSRELLESELDAVVICTPLSSHFKIAGDSLKKGKHVLVEKPFVETTKQARKLDRLAKKQKAILMVGHTFLFNDYFLELVEMVRQGRLGDLRFVTSTRTNLGPIRKDVDVLWDLAPHDISMFIEMVGSEPYEVFVSGGSYLDDEVADVSFITFRFANNIMAHSVLSWLSPVRSRDFIVVGSKKMAIFNDAVKDRKLVVYNKGVTVPPRGISFEEYEDFGIYQGEEEEIEVDYEQPLVRKLEHFFDCIEAGKKPKTDGENGLQVVRVLEACSESMKKNKPIELD